MAKQLQIRGGTTAQHSTFTGAVREITVDTDKDVVVVHDGSTAGGFPLAKQTSVDAKVAKVTSTDNAVVRFDGTTGDVQNSSVVIDDNGNVGIGTSIISNKLEVNGSIGFGSAFGRGRIYTDANWGCLLQSAASSPLAAEFAFLNNAGAYLAWIDTAGNLLLKSGNGGLGYGTGAGGTVTQLTSKSTAVTLNKPCGTIYTHNENLANGASVSFVVYNNLLTVADLVYVYGCDYSYLSKIVADNTSNSNGIFNIRITNNSGYGLPESLRINFVIIKGAIA